MKTRWIIGILLLFALLAPSSAFAVRKVEKKPKKQQTSTAKQAVDKSDPAADRQENQPAENKGKVETPDSPERNKEAVESAPEVKKREREDRFIDENSDGINDKIDHGPVIKVRKRDNPPTNSPRKEEQKRENPDKSRKGSRRNR